MTFIHPTAVIYPNVEIGENCYIGPLCVIGAPPEHPALGITEGCGVMIGNGVKLHKAVVIDSGTKLRTWIMDNVEAMSGTHIGHDVIIGEGVILAPGAKIGGHSVVAEQANIGMGAAVHQNCTVPARCMVGILAVITKAVAARMGECETWAGNPARKLGMNKKYVK